MPAAVFLITTFGLLFLAAPIFISILAPTFFAIEVFGQPVPQMAFTQRLVEGINSFALLAIPLFIFSADIISRGQIGARLLAMVESMLGHLTGGVAITTAVACALFGAISGVGAAAVVSIGPIVYPALLRQGYSRSFAVGLILASSTLAMLIPPSVSIIIFALQTNGSVGQLFLSGLSAGVLLTAAFAFYAWAYAKTKGIGKTPRASASERLKATREGAWALGLPGIIFGGIYTGAFTPTEAAGAACIYAIVVETLVYKQLKLREILNVSSQSAMTISTLMILISAGSVLTFYLTLEQVPQQVSQILQGQPAFVILLLINVIFLLAGMFVDPSSAIIVFSPLIYPAAIAAGIDPVHLGAVIVLNVALGMITPPMGMNIFLGIMTFKVSYMEAVRGSLPFILVALGVLVLVTYIPVLTTWLPKLAYG